MKVSTLPLRRRLAKTAKGLKDVLAPQRKSSTDEEIAARAREFAPVVWLLGKVQSGKSSIIRVMTECTSAEIGQGFKACTKTAQIFDFPEEAPLIRFLDTRGLGEVGYDSAEDLTFCEAHAHMVIVTMRALDHQQDAILDVVHTIRRRHPEWSIIVAQTTLHEGYESGARHALPYPYAGNDPATLRTAGVSADLIRSLAHQRSLFKDVPGKGPIVFVPIDFTLPGDDWEPIDYGYDALLGALERIAPHAVVTSLHNLHGDASDALSARAHPHIIGYATAAGAADLWPLAGVALVPAVQAKLIHTLAAIYDVDWNRRVLSEFAGALGASTLVRIAGGFGARELAKLIPLYGQTAGAAAAAAMSFATTYALGKAACYFLKRRRAGQSDPEGVAATYREALTAAIRLARERGLTPTERTKDQ